MSTSASPDRDGAEVTAFRERFASVLTDLGMPRMPSRVFAALFAEDSGRLTAAELAETLQVSPAAISGAVRYLGQVNMISREREPGSRRDHFLIRNDMWQRIIANRDQMFGQLEDNLRDGIRVLGPDSPAATRAAETVAFFKFLQAEMPKVLARWYEHRAALVPDAAR